MTWLDSDGGSDAVGALSHHSLDPYGLYKIVWQQQMWCHHGCKQSELWLSFGAMRTAKACDMTWLDSDG